MSSLMTSSGCRQQRREIGRFVLVAVAYGALAAGSSAVLAQSGDIAGDASFLVPEETCDELRDLVDGNPGNNEGDFTGDIIIVCDGGGAEGRRSCEVVSGSTIPPGPDPAPSAGQGIGFCADRFPDGLQLVEGQEELKLDVTVLATSFGAITGTSVVEAEVADLVCETFVEGDDGVRICRRVVEIPEESDPSPPPLCDDSVEFIRTPPTTADNEFACSLIAEVIGNAVTEVDPTDLAFALFFDVGDPDSDDVTVSQPGSEALFVCTDRELQCFTPGTDEDDLTDLHVDYQISKIVVQEDPDCVRIGGRRYC